MAFNGWRTASWLGKEGEIDKNIAIHHQSQVTKPSKGMPELKTNGRQIKAKSDAEAAEQGVKRKMKEKRAPLIDDGHQAKKHGSSQRKWDGQQSTQ